jgi:hypothetical protein
MDLTTLISPEEAAERLEQYQRQVKEERTAEDDAIRAGLRAAQRGLPVISLTAAVAAGGWFPNGLPRIAVVRADATECWVRPYHRRVSGVTELVFRDQRLDQGRARVGLHRVSVDVPAPKSMTNQAWDGHTIVPSIPPQHRPNRRRLHRFHILWEVERWDPTPPVDPALIKHIRGDLWSVQAVWDLTPLERAVLTGRAG